MTEPLLNIDTLIERPLVKIDGELHEIVTSQELPLMVSQKVAVLGRRLDTLMKTEDLDVAGQKLLASTLDKIADIVMAPVPIEVRAKLTQAHKLAVLEVFTMLSLGQKVRLAGAMMRQAVEKAAPTTETMATGEASSPGSSGSSAATPSAG